MNTTAYVTSNAPRKAELDAQIAAINDQIKEAELQIKDCRAGSPQGRALKKQIAALTEQRLALRDQMPATLFSEANALADLEAEIEAGLSWWERQKAGWLADAAVNPAYAVQNARQIVAEQAKAEQIERLQQHWQRLAEQEGRILATFRKAYNQVAARRQRDMMSKLTGGGSTCAFHNAVERRQGCALAEYDQYHDDISTRLVWYEQDAQKLAHTD